MMRSLFSVMAVALCSYPVAAEPPRIPRLIAQEDAFSTLVNPTCSHCKVEAKRRAGELRKEDRVLCWIRGYSQGGAIPQRFFLNRYRVISDTYGVFVHDPDAGYARGFAPSLDFTFYGWHNGIMVMKHKDGTLYSCLSGRAFAGPRKGTRLRPVPTLVSTWGDWLEHYPNAVAYHMYDKYKPTALPTTIHKTSARSRGPADDRLPENQVVLGVRVGEKTRAYPLEAIAKETLLRDRLGKTDLVILWSGLTNTAVAYRPMASPPEKGKGKPRPVTLAVEGKGRAIRLVDKETGSHWDIAGRAVDGELKGWVLEWLDGTQVKWYAWAAEYPATSIHGK
jgi:hypothetical protein